MKKKSKKPAVMRQTQKINPLKRIFGWLSRYLYDILYIGILFILWGYIIFNWEKCISMQFFSQFDGNNILFLVGIVLVILPFYEVEGSGFKIKGVGIKALQEDLERSQKKYYEDSMQNLIDKMQSKEVPKSDGSDSK